MRKAKRPVCKPEKKSDILSLISWGKKGISMRKLQIRIVVSPYSFQNSYKLLSRITPL